MGDWAYTGRDTTVSMEGTLTIYAPGSWLQYVSKPPSGPLPTSWPFPLSGLISLGPMSYSWSAVFDTEWVEPSTTNIHRDIYIRFAPNTAPGGVGGLTNIDYQIGTFDFEYSGLPPGTYTWEFSNTDLAVPISISIGPFREYQRRIVNERIPVEPNGPSSPCHPLHYDMEFTWAPSNAVINVDIGGLTTNTNYGGTGYTKELPTTSASVASDTRSLVTAVSGVKADFTYDSYSPLVDSASLAFYDSETDGDVTITASNNTIEWEATTSTTNIPEISLVASRYPDYWVSMDVTFYDWYAHASNEILAEIGHFTELTGVGTQYEDTPLVTNRKVVRGSRPDWSNHSVPETVLITLSNGWAESFDEDTIPHDRDCEMEFAGLGDVPSTSYDSGCLKIRRRLFTSVDFHESNDSAPPSEWSAVGTGITAVRNAGKDLEVGLSSGGSGYLTRTYYGVYGSYFIDPNASPSGWDDPGPPMNYEMLRHLTATEASNYGLSNLATDVQNWANYRWLRLEYSSSTNQVLTLSVVNRSYAINDPHVTGSTRRADFSWTSVDRTHTLGTFVCSPATNAYLYLDTQYDTDRTLQHVQSVTLTGFSNQTVDAQTWTLHDLGLVPYNPTAETENGRLLIKTAMRRPDPSSELPLDYVVIGGSAEGAEAIFAPDMEESWSFAKGLRGVEMLRGATTGVIMDYMVDLPAENLGRQEGLEVYGLTNSPTPWSTSSSTYSNAFADASNNDMLGGLKAGDLVEYYPLEIGTLDGTNWTAVPTRPRVRGLVWHSGITNYALVRKHLHWVPHGIFRVSGAPAPNTEVVLWRADIPNVQEATFLTDDWGYALPTNGVKEAFSGAIGGETLTSADTWVSARNRGWARTLLGVAGLEGVSVCYFPKTAFQLARVYPTVRWSNEVSSETGPFVTVDTVKSGDGPEYSETTNPFSNPDIVHTLFGQVGLVVDDADLGGLRYLRGDSFGRSEVSVSTLVGYSYPSVCLSPTTGRIGVAARSSSTLQAAFYYVDLHGTWEQRAVNIAAQDACKAGVIIDFYGNILLFVPSSGVIHVYRSRDDGATWTEVA